MGDRLETRLKIKRGTAYVGRRVRRFLGLDRPDDVKRKLETYRRYWEDAARILSAEFVPLADGFWEVRLNGRSTRIHGWHVPLGDPVAIAISRNKPLCYRYAMNCDVPVPPHGVFRLEEMAQARKFLTQNPGIYVVKPTSGDVSGVAITTHVRTPRQLEDAAVAISFFTEEFLLERMIFGESFRLLYLDGAMIHAVRRRGIRIVGDGRSTIAELLTGQGLGKAALDLTTWATLESQGLLPHSVPANGRETLARSVPAGLSKRQELCTAYDEKITHLICPAIVWAIGRLLEVLGTKMAGVDIVTTDPTASLKESGGVLLEVNPMPGIHRHYMTPEDHGPDSVGVKVLKYLLQESRHTPLEPALTMAGFPADRRITHPRD